MPAPPFDVGAFLRRVEAAAPIEAVEEVADALGEWIGAHRVAFLIADFSGRAVVRLTSSGPAVDGARRYSHEQAETIPLRAAATNRSCGPSGSTCSRWTTE